MSVPLEFGLRAQVQGLPGACWPLHSFLELCACSGLEQLRLGLGQAGEEGRSGSAWLQLCGGYSGRSQEQRMDSGLSLTGQV